MGAKNRLNESGIEIERLDLPLNLFERIRASYRELDSFLLKL